MRAPRGLAGGLGAVARPLVRRGLVVWALARAVVTFAARAQAGGTSGADGELGPAGVAGVVVACAALGYVDLRRRREAVLLGNLGVSGLTLGVLLTAPAVGAEAVFAAAQVWLP